MSDTTSNTKYVPVTAANSPKINTPGGGYKTESLLTNIIKTEGAKFVQKKGADLVSKQLSKQTDKLMGKVGGKLAGKLGSKFASTGGLMGSAQNLAANSARSVTDKLQTAIGGKATALLGNKFGGIAGQLGGKVAGAIANAATKTVTNLATGAINKVSSAVSDATSGVKGKAQSMLSAALGSAGSGMLGNVLGKVGDTAAKNLAGASFAPGFLETGPRAETKAIDPYGVSDNGIVSTITDTVKDAAATALEDVRATGAGLLSDLTPLRLKDVKNFKQTKERLASRITDMFGGRESAIKSMPDAMQSTIGNGLGLPDEAYDRLVVTIGEAVKTYDADDVENARQVYNVIAQVTNSRGTIDFVDVAAKSALIAGCMREAIMLGDFSAVKVLLENLDDESSYNALYANVQVALEYSELDTILYMIDKLGVERILSMIPDAPQQLLANYKLPTGTTSEDYVAELIALVAALDLLKPNWGQVMRNGVYISDVRAYADLSEDAMALMIRDDTYVVQALIAPSFVEPVGMADEFKKIYDLTPI